MDFSRLLKKKTGDEKYRITLDINHIFISIEYFSTSITMYVIEKPTHNINLTTPGMPCSFFGIFD